MSPAHPGLLRIGISLGNMGSLQDGLGEFAVQMGGHIAAHAVDWRDRLGIAFDFHCRQRLFGAFGDQVGYRPVTRWQRLRHVQPAHYALWHSLHQLNKTQTPQGCGPRVVTVHDLNYVYKASRFSVWRDHRRARALMRRSDYLVAISEYTAADVRRHLGWTGPMEVIHRGPRPYAGDRLEPIAGFEDPARPFLFHLSRMSPSKNPQALLGLAAAWPEMTFLFCGPPTDDARALKAATHLPNVHFRFSISEAQKAWAFSRCAGFLFPSFTEGFGLPPIEAMQFGKPVFLSRLTSLPEVGGDAAYYFDDWSPAAMRVVVDAGLRRGAEPARQAQVKAHAARFDWKQAADRYLALYLRLLGRSEPIRPAEAGQP
ncbi:MAG: glycosyltransferase [Burkholderiales bacterium]|nr:glycosyltransferase [Burkholderiales bacterium]